MIAAPIIFSRSSAARIWSIRSRRPLLSLIGVFDGFTISGPFFPLIAKQLTLDGIQVGNRNGLDALVRAVDRIKLKPVIDTEYPFADLPAALDHLARGPFGKIVVRVPD